MSPRASVTESWTTRWSRRAITIPLTFLLTIASFGLVPLVLPLATLVDILVPRQFGRSRTVLFLWVFLICETLGILWSFFLWLAFLGRMTRKYRRNFIRANSRLQAWWVKAIFSATQKLFHLRVVIDGAEIPKQQRPLLVFVRHASTVDTGLPILLLARPLGYQLRYVLKRELLFDPCIDIVGQRIPNRFVRRGDRSVDEVEWLSTLYDDLDNDEGVVIFPEGTRFSPQKREELLAHLESKDSSPTRELASELQHTLPPLRKGPLALLEKNPGCDLLVIAHRGLEQATSFASFTRGTLVGAELAIRVFHVPYPDIPRTPDEQRKLLADLWREVDRFAGENASGNKSSRLRDPAA